MTLEGVAAEERQGKLVAEIAAETGAGHLVYSSVAGADLHTGIPHIESKCQPGSARPAGRRTPPAGFRCGIRFPGLTRRLLAAATDAPNRLRDP